MFDSFIRDSSSFFQSMESIVSNYECSSSESDSSEIEDGDLRGSDVSKTEKCNDYFGLQQSSSDASCDEEDLHAEMREKARKQKLIIAHTDTLIEAFEHKERSFGPLPNNNFSKDSIQTGLKRQEINKVSWEHRKRHKKQELPFVEREVSISKLSMQSNELHPIIYKHSCQPKKNELSVIPNSRDRYSFKHHSRCVNALEWGPRLVSHHLLLSASMDGSIKICNAFSNNSDSVLYSNKTHDGCAVKCAKWHCGVEELVLSGGYDKNARIVNISHGVEVRKYEHSNYVNCLKIHPVESNNFLTGSYEDLSYWDMRQSNNQPVRNYKANFKEVQDVEFLPGGNEFICCTNLVTRDSADRNIVAWDLRTGAILSNQIFHERYHCTCLRIHPENKSFLAQTNGNYIASFSATRPYKMNRKMRYECHKVEGYRIGFDFSRDGHFLYSGSSDGKIYAYNYFTGKLSKTLNICKDPLIAVESHPFLPSMIAIGTWSGSIHVVQ